MNIKMKMSALRTLLETAASEDWSDLDVRSTIKNLVSEADEQQVAIYEPLEKDSLDAKVDSFLIKAENPDSDMMESRYISFDKFLREAPEDEVPAEEDQDPEQLATDDDDAQTPDVKLDVHQFANEVARLTENFENLVDIRGSILRRSLNYVGKNHGAAIAKQVEDILEQNFNISLKKKDLDYDTVPPPAAGAGPGSAD